MIEYFALKNLLTVPSCSDIMLNVVTTQKQNKTIKQNKNKGTQGDRHVYYLDCSDGYMVMSTFIKLPILNM